MNDETITLKMFLAAETPLAVKLAQHPRLEQGRGTRVLWIPRTCISYARKQAPTDAGDWPTYTFTLPEWKVDREQLWDFAQ
jgi:hypothetical protein